MTLPVHAPKFRAPTTIVRALVAREIAPLPDLLVDPLVRAALAEDLGRAGDITSEACVPPDARLACVFAARDEGVVAGLACARLALAALDPASRFEAHAADGDTVSPGAVLARVDGTRARSWPPSESR
jgi:nicotinate-nucleotide pyrophosphorylase (carboxylating)